MRPLATVTGRDYHACDRCGLAFMSPAHFPSADEERRHYGTHHNDPADARYRAFLSRVADPLVPRLRPGAEGLDYGSGPGPTLSVMLREQGFAVRDYDPFFAPGADALARTYDFITCTETDMNMTTTDTIITTSIFAPLTFMSSPMRSLR